jgi:adenine deaminase
VCTDDVFPDYLVEKGGVCDVVRRMIRYGMAPLQAIRCATINNAMRLRRDDLGMVCAGRRADLAILSDLREVKVAEVYAGGRRVAVNGELTEALQPSQARLPERSMKLERLSADDFRVRVPGVANGRAVLRTIRGARFNTWSELEVAVKDGYAVVPPDVSVMTVVHRHGRSDLGPQAAIIEGWDRWGGAYATSYSHDSHNLVVYGFDPEEMALAANTVIEMGGGDAVVKNGRVAAKVAFPVAGLLSPKPPAQVAREHHAVVEAAGTVVKWEGPYRTFKALSGQCLACNPGPHLTDQGLTDGETKKIFGVLLRAA